MKDLRELEDEVSELLKRRRNVDAQEKITEGLKKFPNEYNLLNIARDAYLATDDREKAFEFASLMITHYPESWKGYSLAAQDLWALNQFREAEGKIKEGLEQLPNNFYLLTFAADIFHSVGFLETSLEFAERLITHHQNKPSGYILAIRELVALKRFPAAKQILVAGLDKSPNHRSLLSMATHIYRASGDRKQSLRFAALMITHHPRNWLGYGLAAQDLVALKQFTDAQQKVQEGLEKFPNHFKLLTIAINVFGISGDKSKILMVEKLLTTYYKSDWRTYAHIANYYITAKNPAQAYMYISKASKILDFASIVNLIREISNDLSSKHGKFELTTLTKELILNNPRFNLDSTRINDMGLEQKIQSIKQALRSGEEIKLWAKENLSRKSRFISLGQNCVTAWYLKQAGLKKESYPFDWVFSSAEIIDDCIATNFSDYLDREMIEKINQHSAYHTKYHSAMFPHKNPLNSTDDYQYYERCCFRFNQALRSGDSLIFFMNLINHFHIPEWSNGFLFSYSAPRNQNRNSTLQRLNSLFSQDRNHKLITISYIIKSEVTHSEIRQKDEFGFHIGFKAQGRMVGTEFINILDDFHFKILLNSFKLTD